MEMPEAAVMEMAVEGGLEEEAGLEEAADVADLEVTAAEAVEVEAAATVGGVAGLAVASAATKSACAHVADLLLRQALQPLPYRRQTTQLSPGTQWKAQLLYKIWNDVTGIPHPGGQQPGATTT